MTATTTATATTSTTTIIIAYFIHLYQNVVCCGRLSQRRRQHLFVDAKNLFLVLLSSVRRNEAKREKSKEKKTMENVKVLFSERTIVRVCVCMWVTRFAMCVCVCWNKCILWCLLMWVDSAVNVRECHACTAKNWFRCTTHHSTRHTQVTCIHVYLYNFEWSVLLWWVSLSLYTFLHLLPINVNNNNYQQLSTRHDPHRIIS